MIVATCDSCGGEFEVTHDCGDALAERQVEIETDDYLDEQRDGEPNG